jgi:hypothetical protein
MNLMTALNAWTSRAWAEDTRAITRWVAITTALESAPVANATAVMLVRCVLGWDGSDLPEWVRPCVRGRLTRTVVSHGALASFSDLLQAVNAESLERAEARRVVLPTTDWEEGASSQTWNLRLPVVAYEVWSEMAEHHRAAECWAALTGEERIASGVSEAQRGYLGSTVVLLPQVRPYFLGTEDLLIPGGPAGVQDLRLVSEVIDGPVVLARTSTAVMARPGPPTGSASGDLRMHYMAPTFAAMNETPLTAPECVTSLPRQSHGLSGSDFRITVVGPGSDVDTASVGLVRGLGSGYFTRERWRQRAPTAGFSAPARVTHISDTTEAISPAFDCLRRAGAPATICDPFADAEALDLLREIASGGVLLTRAKALAGRGITEPWASSLGIEVQLTAEVHDRFVIGPRGGDS